MLVHYPFLVFALVLLWFPRSWLRYGMRVTPRPPRRVNQAKQERDPFERGVKPFKEGAKSRNWVDLLRTAVGSYALTTMAFTAPGLPGTHAPTLVAQGAILVFAVLFQMIRIEGRLSFFAPIFFLQGMTFGICGGLVGGLTMLGSWALSPVLPGAGALLFVQGGLALILGLLLQVVEPKILMILAGATWLPVVLSVLMRKRLSASFDKRLKVISREEQAAREAAVSEKTQRED